LQVPRPSNGGIPSPGLCLPPPEGLGPGGVLFLPYSMLPRFVCFCLRTLGYVFLWCLGLASHSRRPCCLTAGSIRLVMPDMTSYSLPPTSRTHAPLRTSLLFDRWIHKTVEPRSGFEDEKKKNPGTPGLSDHLETSRQVWIAIWIPRSNSRGVGRAACGTSAGGWGTSAVCVTGGCFYGTVGREGGGRDVEDRGRDDTGGGGGGTSKREMRFLRKGASCKFLAFFSFDVCAGRFSPSLIPHKLFHKVKKKYFIDKYRLNV